MKDVDRFHFERSQVVQAVRLRETSSLICLFTLVLSLASSMLYLPDAYGQQRQADPYAAEREKLVKNHIAPFIRDKDVVNAIAITPRHEFVPREYVAQAYKDIAIPIGEAQTISSPFIVASMTESLRPKKTDKVLEIGTGSGYQAAVLSPLVKDVYTIEIVEDLGAQTMQLFEDLGTYPNVHCLIGDGFKGWKENAPFDKIIVTCSPESVPDALRDQLKEGGLMVIPLGERYQQMLYLMRKKNGKLEAEELQPTLFVPMTGAAEDLRKVAPDPANPKLLNTGFEQPLIRNFHIPGWYYQFGCIVVEDSEAPEGSKVAEFRSANPEWPNHLLQGIAIDGSKVKRLKLGAWVSLENVKVGADKEKAPAVAIQYFDENRNRLGYNFVGGIKGTQKWKKIEKIVTIPPGTREAIVSIGLFGAEGVARFDNIIFEPLFK